jgi:acyl dehydratase
MAALTLKTLDAFVGETLGVSSWHLITQEAVDAFAACTGDHQWIHVDVARARRESPFGAPVAHGYLTLSLVAGLSMEIGVVPEGASAALNYGLDRVRFLAPVPVGSRLRLRSKLLEAQPRDAGRVLMRLEHVLELEGSERPALIAEALALLVPEMG